MIIDYDLRYRGCGGAGPGNEKRLLLIESGIIVLKIVGIGKTLKLENVQKNIKHTGIPMLIN